MSVLGDLKVFIFSAPILAGIALAGCSPQPAQNATAPVATPVATQTVATPDDNVFKVGLLTPGDVNDDGWNQLAYEGLQAIKKSTGAKISHQVTKNSSDQQPALRDYADQNFDLIICHGFEYGDRVGPVAAKHTKTGFVVVGGNVEQYPNVGSLVPKLEEATYLLGMVAGGITKSNKVGLVGGMKIPVITSTFQAFEAGAKAVNPKVVVLTNYVGNFEDQNAAKEAARTMIADGADVLFHNADQAGKGVFSAAQQASNVWMFGSNRNQNNLAPTVCLASAVIDMPRAFVELARHVKAGEYHAGKTELNLADKTIGVVWNDALKSKIPASLLKRVMSAHKDIVNGKLKIKRNV